MIRGNRLVSHKVPTNRAAPAMAVVEAVASLDPPTPFDVILGSTIATNAFLERRGDRVALICTRGFRDILQIARQTRSRIYDLNVVKPAPFVRPDDTYEVTERIGARGDTLTPVDETEARDILDDIKCKGIRDVAVCLLFSFIAPQHEKRLGQLAADIGLIAHLSCEILPEFREFERASTTAVNAYVAAPARSYILDLQQRLSAAGARKLRIMQSSGGQIAAAVAARHPVRTILSGPAGGVVAAQAAARELGIDNILTYDMGGTSTDVCTCIGEPMLTCESIVDGWPIGVEMLHIETIGAGGGSIARVDAGGLLVVGPESAGADPGPACYGQSELPTVTDANVFLNRIRPEFFLGGKMTIHPDASRRAIENLAKEMKTDPSTAALGIVRIANAAMERAIRSVSAARGHDPRELWLVSFGGAGGLHACALAEALNMPGVIIPNAPGVLSALGMTLADTKQSFSKSIRRLSSASDLKTLQQAFGQMMDVAAKAIFSDGYDLDDVETRRFADMRYRGQNHEITVPIESLTDPNRLYAPFHQAHHTQFGHARYDQSVEITTIRVQYAVPSATTIRTVLSNYTSKPEKPATHNVTFNAQMPTLFYERASLPPKDEIFGPAVIVEPSATVLLPPGWSATVSIHGHLTLKKGSSFDHVRIHGKRRTDI